MSRALWRSARDVRASSLIHTRSVCHIKRAAVRFSRPAAKLYGVWHIPTPLTNQETNVPKIDISSTGAVRRNKILTLRFFILILYTRWTDDVLGGLVPVGYRATDHT